MKPNKHHKPHAFKQVAAHKHRSRERALDLPESTCISDGSYDPRSKELTLTFMDGTTYVYDSVTRATVKDLENADSVGAEFNYEIR